MSTNVTREEFDSRMRVFDGELEGEKLVTRYIVEQTQRNGDYLAAVRTRIDHLANDVALVRGAVTGHTALLNVLVQDVGRLRQETGGMRRDMGTMRTDIAAIGPLHQEVTEMRRDMGQFHQEMGEMRRDMGQFRQEVAEMRRDMGTMHTNIAAIRAALAPHDPLAGN